MALTNNKKMLICGFDKDEIALIDDLINKNSLPNYRIISSSMISMKIKDILNGIKIEIFTDKSICERVILFNNLSDEELNISIKEISSVFNPRPILAVITPTSIEWDVAYLIEHLVEEREWFKNHKE
jgi:galactitol-specific phosphotransferase system IIB component